MPEMEPVIGLEIHAQLRTATKLFCSCPTTGNEEPNSRICEICSGQPGALPRLNARAVELAALAGLTLGAQVYETSLFARKNYFYPDLPNGFQTSQLDPPICRGGGLQLPEAGRYIRLNRLHLEDDAGKCLHDDRRGRTLVDLNRAGTPLIEIVTEPDLRSAGEVVEFLKKIHALLVHAGVTAGRLEEGEFRCDVNISLKPWGAEALGLRGEIKNLNSFRHAAQAVDYEISRQGGLYARGEPVAQETRLFDPGRQETRALRSKEEAHDYRYFPQPDLPPVAVPLRLLERLRAEMPRSPEEIRGDLLSLGLSAEQAAVLLGRRGALEYFQAARKILDDPPRLAALMVELLLPAAQREGLFSPLESACSPAVLAALARLLAADAVSRRAAYDRLFPELFTRGGDPEALARAQGIMQISDAGALEGLAAGLVAEHPEEARKYREGQKKVLSFFVGQLMRRSRGAANPKLAGEILSRLLKG